MEETKEEIIQYKIYKITCNITGDVYFGKTTKTLEERLHNHEKESSCTSRQIILRGDYKIEQIDSTFDEDESIILERYHIETFECVNERIPGRTKKEWCEDNKEELSEYHKKWREEHKEEISEYMKEYREEHKEEISEYMKEYREAHKEEISEYMKEYREAHKDEILEKRKQEKYTCECGSTLRIVGKARHERSQKHIDYINSKK